MRATAMAAAAAVTACGCVSVTKIPMQEKWIGANAAYVLSEGPHTVAGQSFMRTVGGDVKTCAGNEVLLIPATAYAAERMRITFGSDRAGLVTPSVARSEPASTHFDYWHYQRRTRCDAEGRFAFTKTADGDYYLLTYVIWQTGQAYSLPQGGVQMRRVVAGRDSENLIIAP